MSEFKPRKWQSQAVNICRTVALRGSDRALIYACPGSGKTYCGLLIASDLGLRGSKGPKIVVLTPNLAIKTQWIDRAASIGLRLLPVKSGEDLRQDSLAMEDVGFILSYQQAVSLKHSLKQYCDSEKPIVILDEVHHTEGPRADKDGNAWGHAVEYACAKASFKLCTTGTPFREGDNPISFVDYGDDGTATALVSYTYSDAIRDGVCRPIEFAMFEGRIQWMDGAASVAASFGDKLTKKRARQRLRAALSTDGGHPRTLLLEADRKLSEIRANGGSVDGRAAGLVVAMDTVHADEIATELASITGVRPVVVHNKVDDAQEAINAFREGDARWIVGINMLSEGVDIPRLRVGVYASNIRASLYFHQFCGRFARVMESRHERSFVYMPADDELEAIALTIEQYRAHALGEEVQKHIRRIGGNGRPRGNDLEVLGSDGHQDRIGVSGQRFPVDYIETHRVRITTFRTMDAARSTMSDGEILKIMIDLGVVPPPFSEAAE